MRRLAGLTIAASLLTACATGGFEPRIVAVCPPVVEYSREFQARAAEEVELLPKGSGRISMSSCSASTAATRATSRSAGFSA